MGTMDEHYDIIRTGRADMAMFLPQQTPGLFPLYDIPNLPCMFRDYEVSCRAWWELYKAGYLEGQLTEVTTILAWCGQGWAIYGHEPITSLADIKGGKFGSGGEQASKQVEAMGGTMVQMMLPEFYPGLEKGIIDGVFLPWVAIGDFHLEEVLSSYLGPGFGDAGDVIGMNNKTYASFPDDVKAIVAELAEEVLLPSIIKDYQDTEAASRATFVELGGTLYQWSEADLAELEGKFAGIWTNWISETEAKGLPAKKTVDALYKIAQDLGTEKPMLGYAPGQ
jgi:TRAP-type C4-dicarboxylate transport system substrate-binding protein